MAIKKVLLASSVIMIGCGIFFPEIGKLLLTHNDKTGMLSADLIVVGDGNCPIGENCQIATNIKFVQNTLIDFPEIMRIDETGIVSATFDSYVLWDDGYKERSPNGGSVQVGLLSQGFNIIPSGQVDLSIKRLPVVAKWSVRPKESGDHILILDVSNVLAWPDDFGILRNIKYETNVVMNNSKIEQDFLKDKSIVLKTFVQTIWGISSQWEHVIQWSFAGIGFLISLPLFAKFIDRSPRTSARPKSLSSRIRKAR